MSMAAKSSDLVDKMSGDNLQMEGPADMPSQSVKTLSRDMCDINRRIRGSAPPSHSWTAPLMEDMLCDIRTRLTEVVVTGPGRAVLFYGRH